MGLSTHEGVSSLIQQEFRAHIEVASPKNRPPEDWEKLHKVLDQRMSTLGPVMSRWPDRSNDRAAVTLSVEAAEPSDAGFILTDAVYRALLLARLFDSCRSRVELRYVPEEEVAYRDVATG